jgi:hypothetical protein
MSRHLDRKIGQMRAGHGEPRRGGIAALLVKDDFVLMTATRRPHPAQHRI